MSHHQTQLLSDICTFLERFSISYQSLDFEITEYINRSLAAFWRGSTSKIDWELYSTAPVQKIEFPFFTPIDAQITQQLIEQANFRVLQHPQIILYFSGMSSCLLLESSEFQNTIFYFMDEFCYLDTFFIFAAQSILEQQKMSDFLEIQLFQYFCGHI